MDITEMIVFLFSGYFTCKFLFKWYGLLFSAWPPNRNKLTRYIFGWLPVISLMVIIYTLKVLASFDVINDFRYIVFYIVIGYTWLYFGLRFMFYFFDLSWIDDVINLNNKAAMLSITGGFLGLTVIYAGANIGDGPGWWCVIFAGGLGTMSWIILGLISHKFTNVFERITVGRDIYCGIRFGFYLLAGGLILGRASAGDWTSFYMTIIEFMDGWPVLLLTAFMIIVERYYIYKSKIEDNMNNKHIFSSVFWGITYVIIAVISIMLLPPLKGSVP